jgi:hypothetical protein
VLEVCTSTSKNSVTLLAENESLRPGICGQKMYGTQVHMHRFLLNAKHVRTTDPGEADFFYVPAWPKCMLDAPPNGAGISVEELSARYVKAGGCTAVQSSQRVSSIACKLHSL